MKTALTRAVAIAALAAASTGVVGCGKDDSSTPAKKTGSSTTEMSATTTGNGGATSTAPGAAKKVNANTASQAELTAAFESAGVPNAARWAREVEEYRPYSDDNWASLRQELAKYNIDDATFDKLVSVLER